MSLAAGLIVAAGLGAGAYYLYKGGHPALAAFPAVGAVGQLLTLG